VKDNKQKGFIDRFWKWGLSLLFAVGVFLFWAVPYYSALSYQEQLQLFQWDCGYFWERVCLPGGLSDWLGEFLMQFYYMPVVGAGILAVFFLLLQQMGYCVVRAGKHQQLSDSNGRGEDISFVLSFVPCLLMWAYMGDESVMLGFLVACVFAELAMWGYVKQQNEWMRRWVYPLLMVIVLYWTMGAVVWAFALFVALWQFVDHREGRWVTAAVVVLFTLFVVIGSSVFLPYPLFRLAGGLFYYRFSTVIPLLQILIILSLALMPVLGRVAINWQHTEQQELLGTLGLIALLAVLGFFGIRSQYDEKKYEVIDYDFMVRTGKWQQLIEKAEKKNPSIPTSVACLNLALQQTGQLGDRMFEFFQNGVQGLLPEFQRDFTTPVSTGEIFLHMGMVNEAMRYFYEAQEAIPTYRKSARLTKRLAECNLINGEYEVARKYLRKLEKTLFYRQWAERTMELTKSEKAVNEHRFYGPLRKHLYKDDFLSSDRELDQMIGMMLTSNKENRMAFEYLMAYEQLNGDINRFEQYYSLGQFLQFDHIPRSYLETRLLYWSQHRNQMAQPPVGVGQMMGQRFMEFGQQFSQDGNVDGFRGTYWYYFAKLMKK